MALEHLEGTTYGPVHTSIAAAKVAEYVAVTANRRPERWVSAAPPAYAGALLFAIAPEFLASEAVAGHTAVLIHADQTFAWHAALEVGADVVVTGRVGRVRSRGGVDFVSFDAAVTDSGGSTVLESASTFVLGSEPAGEPPQPRAEPPFEQRQGWLPGPGQEGGFSSPGKRSASRLDLVRYAAASGDFNPIHFDHDAAVAAGLAGVVVHGLLMGAWILDEAANLFGGDRPLERAKLRFREPLFPAQNATLEGELRDSGADADMRLIRSDDEKLLVGAQVGLSAQARVEE